MVVVEARALRRLLFRAVPGAGRDVIAATAISSLRLGSRPARVGLRLKSFELDEPCSKTYRKSLWVTISHLCLEPVLANERVSSDNCAGANGMLLRTGCVFWVVQLLADRSVPVERFNCVAIRPHARRIALLCEKGAVSS